MAFVSSVMFCGHKSSYPNPPRGAALLSYLHHDLLLLYLLGRFGIHGAVSLKLFNQSAWAPHGAHIAHPFGYQRYILGHISPTEGVNPVPSLRV